MSVIHVTDVPWHDLRGVLSSTRSHLDLLTVFARLDLFACLLIHLYHLVSYLVAMWERLFRLDDDNLATAAATWRSTARVMCYRLLKGIYLWIGIRSFSQ